MLLLFSPICSTMLHSCSSVFHCPSILLNFLHVSPWIHHVSVRFLEIPPCHGFSPCLTNLFLESPSIFVGHVWPWIHGALGEVRPLRSCCATCSRSRPPPAPARRCGAMDGWWRGNGIEGRGMLPSGDLSHSYSGWWFWVILEEFYDFPIVGMMIQSDFHIFQRGIPPTSIEHGQRNSGFTHWKWWFSIVFCMFTRGYPLVI